MITIRNDVIERFDEAGEELLESIPLGSPEGFRVLSELWLKSGWDTKYVYGFSWLGRPVIQLPEDLVRIQELIHEVRPTVIVETGVAHGGSLIYYASLFKAMDVPGRVIGVDIEIRPHNREAIEAHLLYPYIDLVEGSSIDPAVVAEVAGKIGGDDRVLVLLDSCHTRDHVRAELEAYAPLVSPGSYIVATDGIMRLVQGRVRSGDDWDWNNPERAALDFVEAHDEYRIVEPAFPFNEGEITERVTYWPHCYVRRNP